MGHKDDIPGSGQWYEASEIASGYKPHYKSDCWLTNNHVYSIIFWSRSMAFKLNPIFDKEQTEIVRFEVDRDFGEQDEKDLFFCNGGVKYSQLENQVPYICGSFTGWRYRKMFNLEDFNRRLEVEKVSPFDIAKEARKIRKNVTTIEKCNEYEHSWINYFAAQEKLRYIYDWRHFFKKYLRFKRPFVANGHFFYEKPSWDGTVPEDLRDDDFFTGAKIFEESSEDIDSEEERKKAQEEEEKKKEPPRKKLLSLEEREKLKALELERKRYPLAVVPNVDKFDKVFIMPIFTRPGKHHYMIKFKDTQDAEQANLLKK